MTKRIQTATGFIIDTDTPHSEMMIEDFTEAEMVYTHHLADALDITEDTLLNVADSLFIDTHNNEIDNHNILRLVSSLIDNGFTDTDVALEIQSELFS